MTDFAPKCMIFAPKCAILGQIRDPFVLMCRFRRNVFSGKMFCRNRDIRQNATLVLFFKLGLVAEWAEWAEWAVI